MASSSGNLTCYTVGLNFVTSSNQYFPCTANDGSHSSCCYAGDYCMADGICHYTHEVKGGTGYYMAGCTDETWQDASCPKPCTSEYGADVTYNMASREWNCCVSTEDNLDCQNPSNFTVSAPAPQSLSTIKQLNTPVPSSAALTPIGSITSVSSAGSMSGLGPNNMTISSSISGPTTAANMTMVFSGSPTRNTSTIISTTSERQRTTHRSTVTSMDVTQQTAQATRTAAAPSSSSSGNAAAGDRAGPKLAILFGLLAAAASDLILS